MAEEEKPLAGAAQGTPAVQSEEDRELLKALREGLKTRIEAEYDEREKMRDDQRFATLDQWPADIRTAREEEGLPCLTVDQGNQYITQVVNDMNKNRPSIKPRPVDDTADVETAKIYQGLVRHIEDQSNAQVAYSTGGQSSATIGLGFFRVTTDYVEGTFNEQDIFIKRIPDTFSVYLGYHIMPDGSDADEGWISVRMPLAEFKRRWPKAKYNKEDFAGIDSAQGWNWRDDDTVAVVEYFYKKYETKTLLFLNDGTTIEAEKYDGPEGGIRDKRETQKCSVHWIHATGLEILERADWAGKYIPIIEVVGKEAIVDGKRSLWGLVRPAKDSLRAFNYWMSALTQKMALAPLAPYVGAVGQFATQGDDWDKANKKPKSRLEYDPIEVNGNALPAPRREQPTQMEPAMAQMLGMLQNNVKSSLGMYKAALGETESQQSGRAILALQKESDTGTAHFGENQSLSIMHCGRILIDLIPKIYDTPRVLRILGEDGQPGSAMIDPNQKESVRKIQAADGSIKRIYNLGVGTFDVTVSVGPSYQTSRQEAATVFTDLANSAKDPTSHAVMQYLAVKHSDFSASDEAVRMLKALLPPALQQADGQNPLSPEAMTKIDQLTKQVQGMQQAGQQLQQENQQLKSGQNEAMAKIAAKKEETEAQLALDREVQDATLRLEKEKNDAAIKLKNDMAAADYDIEQRKLAQAAKAQENKLAFDQQCRAQDQQHQMDTEGRANEEKAMPKFMEALGQIAQAVVISVQEQSRVNAALLAHMESQSKKQIHLGGIKRDSEGRIIGANASVQ